MCSFSEYVHNNMPCLKEVVEEIEKKDNFPLEEVIEEINLYDWKNFNSECCEILIRNHEKLDDFKYIENLCGV